MISHHVLILGGEPKSIHQLHGAEWGLAFKMILCKTIVDIGQQLHPQLSNILNSFLYLRKRPRLGAISPCIQHGHRRKTDRLNSPHPLLCSLRSPYFWRPQNARKTTVHKSRDKILVVVIIIVNNIRHSACPCIGSPC